MKIGITIWEDRVSPVLDTAQRLLTVEMNLGGETSRQILSIPDLPLAQKAQFISSTGIRLLICGAASRFLERNLMSRGVEVIPWIRGPIEAVLAAFCNDQLEDRSFYLPACPMRGRRRQRGGRKGKRARRGA